MVTQENFYLHVEPLCCLFAFTAFSVYIVRPLIYLVWFAVSKPELLMYLKNSTELMFQGSHFSAKFTFYSGIAKLIEVP